MREVYPDWWKYPDGFVDPDDMLDGKYQAIEFIRDLTVNRNKVEFKKLKQMFFRSLEGTIHLTSRQEQAIQWEAYAIRQQIPERKISTFVSQKLGIHRDNAKRLLNRAHLRKSFVSFSDEIVGFNDSVPFHSESRIEIDKRDIKREYAGMTIDCPGNGANLSCLGTARARYGLCSECAKKYGRHQEDRPEWLQELVKSVQREAWADARERVFRREYGTNLDITEVA